MVGEQGALLTIELQDELQNVKLTQIQRNKAVLLLNNMLHNIIIGKYETYVPLARNYFRKVFNDGRYSLWLNKLVIAGILLPRLSYRGTPKYYKGQCIHYKINPKLLTGNCIIVECKSSKREEQLLIKNENWDVSFVQQELRDLKLDVEKLQQEARDTVDAFYIDELNLNENIKFESFYVKNYLKPFEGYSTKTLALESAKKLNGDLIYDNGKFFIDKLENFLERKKKNSWFRYSSAILKLEEGAYYTSRNDTNMRLDHNLTALNTNLLNIILEDNELVEIDMANAQFAILAYVMDTYYGVNAVDFDLFKHHVSKGSLYEFLSRHFKISIKHAKLMMMKIAFPSPRYQSKEKAAFKTIFPTVINFIDDYKKGVYDVELQADKKNAHKYFSILLQSFESRLFVDHFYDELKRDGFWVLTKHDSLIIKKADSQQIMYYLKERMASINFNCTFRLKDTNVDTEDSSMETDELREMLAEVHSLLNDTSTEIAEVAEPEASIPTWQEYRQKNDLRKSIEKLKADYFWLYNIEQK